VPVKVHAPAARRPVLRDLETRQEAYDRCYQHRPA
jgi:hypothetical protein